jgi:hypothetical protein
MSSSIIQPLSWTLTIIPCRNMSFWSIYFLNYKWWQLVTISSNCHHHGAAVFIHVILTWTNHLPLCSNAVDLAYQTILQSDQHFQFDGGERERQKKAVFLS